MMLVSRSSCSLWFCSLNPHVLIVVPNTGEQKQSEILPDEELFPSLTLKLFLLAERPTIQTSILHDFPSIIGIQICHRRCHLCRTLSQIFFEQYSVLVDHERHPTRVAILRGVGNKRESADPFSIH